MESTQHKTDNEKTPLRRAVDWLIKERKIEQDSDLADLFNLSKSTISGYINHTPGRKFRAMFEDHFGISLDKFTDFYESESNNAKPLDMSTPNDTPANKEKFYMDTITDLRHTAIELANANKDACIANKEASVANRILAENQRELIEILKRMHSPIADAARETPLVSLSAATREVMAARGILQGLWTTMDEGLLKLGILVGEGEATKRE